MMVTLKIIIIPLTRVSYMPLSKCGNYNVNIDSSSDTKISTTKPSYEESIRRISNKTYDFSNFKSVDNYFKQNSTIPLPSYSKAQNHINHLSLLPPCVDVSQVESVLIDAINYVSELFPGGSYNKRYMDMQGMRDFKMRAAKPNAFDSIYVNSKEMYNERNFAFKEFRGLTREEQVNCIVRDQGKNIPYVGNCGIKSDLIYKYLTSHSNELFKAMGVNIGETITIRKMSIVDGDHSFVLVSSPQEPLPKPIRECTSTWVCDPWAKVACLAKEYSIRMNNKMEKWSFRKLSIGMLEVKDGKKVRVEVDPIIWGRSIQGKKWKIEHLTSVTRL
ncbi:hypothetical protein [Citrobacter portucalensis]|uniref:hypothetical protein n=1 Tax=Citrobacter portucalensis TaxID=1639133 RepID=UPI00226BBB03|nr:hypothetical protein [Citrobacter portucalensis]MCX8986023.1 hypothetical protein [Citrobacter portucalensis]